LSNERSCRGRVPSGIIRYRQHVLETKGKDLDDAGKALLAEDLRSPCTEEIAVFQAFSRAIRQAREKFVVVDTAPTGHTLLLLDATGAYHRDVMRHLGPGVHARTPMMQLQDPEQTKMLIVTLPETTPVLEAEGLQADLRPLESNRGHGSSILRSPPRSHPTHSWRRGPRRNCLTLNMCEIRSDESPSCLCFDVFHRHARSSRILRFSTSETRGHFY
jgi:hypothetical protein